LIIDNASVHRDEENLPKLLELLDTFGITLVYLPTYSPELNPCELVFQYIKKRIRDRKTSRDSLLDAVIDAASDINIELMESFYFPCCNFEKIKERINSGCLYISYISLKIPNNNLKLKFSSMFL
jgi:transposase